MTGEIIELVEDHDKYCMVSIDGKLVKAHKLDLEQLQRIHRESIEKLAKGLTREMVESLISMLTRILYLDLFLKDYLRTAEHLTNLLKNYYEIIGSPNAFHYYIKNIDPEIYGKGQTFLKEVESLLKMMDEVLSYMNLQQGEDYGRQTESS